MAAILIVEDEDAIRLSLRNYLKGRGYDVLVASEGVGAIKQLLDNEVDLIVTDYRMGLFGGDYWIRFLQRFCPSQRVILTSGYLAPNAEMPFPVVMKPYDYKDLEALIARGLSDG